jgi:hypothetical protein
MVRSVFAEVIISFMLKCPFVVFEKEEANCITATNKANYFRFHHSLHIFLVAVTID